MADWHGYFVVERGSISSGNWATLVLLFKGMGVDGSPFPAHNNHWRARMDSDAVIYESRFDTSEVSISSFKQLLADEFSVPVENIVCNESEEAYAGGVTVAWDFLYNAISRFIVRRFGGGGSSWIDSLGECHGYLSLYSAEWGE